MASSGPRMKRPDQATFSLTASSSPIYFYLFSFSGSFRWRRCYTHPLVQWVLALILSLIAAVAIPGLDLIYGIWTEEITAAGAPSQSIRDASDRAGYIMLAVGCSQLLLFWISMYLFMISSEELTNRLRVVYVSSLLAKDVGYFAHHGPGELSSRIGTDIEAVRVGLGEKMAYVGQSLGIMLASTILGFVRSASIAGVLFPIIPLVLGLFTLLGIASEKISSPASSLDGQVATFMEQLLTAPRILHAFDATQTLLRKLDNAFLTPLSKWNRRRAMIRAVELSAVYVILLWLYGAFFAWGAHQISRGSTSVGPAITAFWSFVNVFFSLANLVPHLGSILQAFSSLKALRHTIEEVPAIDARDQSGIRIADDPQRAPNFRFEDVTYAYPSRPRVAALNRINLEIEANKVTAFVGASGSGKSTMMALLLREFDPEPRPRLSSQSRDAATSSQKDMDVEKQADLVCNGGRILYAGHDLRDLNVESYRSEIGIISQHLQLFTGSVLDNVSAGLTQPQCDVLTGEALRIRAKAALVKAQAWDFVSELPSGMDTQLKGGHSNMLSGGQRQRLALARALIREPTVLFLDEATSALDSNTEEQIRISLEAEQEKRNMTCCIIAHRLSTIRHADKIVVFAAGKIVDQGTHDELMQTGRQDDTYRRMVLKTPNGQAQEAGDHSDDDNEKGTRTFSSPKDRASSQSSSGTEASSDLRAVGISMAEDGVTRAAKPVAHEAVQKPLPLAMPALSQGTWRQLWSKTQNRRLALAVGTIATSVGAAVFPVSGYVTGEGIAAISSSDLEAVRTRGYFWALIFLALGFAAVILYTMQGYFIDEASSYICTVLKRDSLESILGQSMTYFDLASTAKEKADDRKVSVTGSAANLSQHPSNIATGISVAFGQSILCLGNVLASFGIGLGLSWKMTLVAFAPLLLIPPLSYVTITRLQGAEKHYTQRAERCSEYLSEQVDGIRTVIALGRQRSVLATFEEKAKVKDRVASRRSLLIGTLAFAAGQSFMLIPAGLIFWYSGLLLAQDDIGTAAIFGVFEVQIISGFAMARFVSLIPDISRAIASSRVVFEWLSMAKQEGTVNTREAVAADDNFRIGDITFDEVVLHYPQRPEYPALKGISLTIKKGSTVALVGTSGSGKSTLLSLLSRFYEPTSGRVLLDGKDLKSLDVRRVRSRCALVSQDAVLFQGTVAENIALGATRPEQASDESIRFACEQAGVLEFVQSLPESFDSEIGLKGFELSGGQRQRLCIARALIRSPEVLLLDETTSALDAESEAVIQASLDRASEGRTTLLVAHRLSTVRNADCIYVFEDGRVVESGTHQELLRARGRYLELIEAQL